MKTLRTSDILRDAARAAERVRRYDKATRKRLQKQFDRRYGELATWNARSALWTFFDWQNGEIPQGRDHHILALLFAAEAIESN